MHKVWLVELKLSEMRVIDILCYFESHLIVPVLFNCYLIYWHHFYLRNRR